jgi:membrane protein
MLRALRIPIGWTDLAKRTAAEVVADNCLGLAAQLAYYFVLALFPALLFLVALISFIPIANLMEMITAGLTRVAPAEALTLVQDQVLKIADGENGGLLTLGMLGTIWSTSAGVTAIIDTLNQAYDIRESRPWWKVRLTAIGLTLGLAVFIIASMVLVVAGPALADRAAAWMHAGPAMALTWKIVQWPVIFGLVSLAIAIVYYHAPDAEQEWIWITPGSIFAAALWLAVSLGFKFYVANFGSYNATYGAIGGVIVLMLWFYLSGLAVLVGAELNAEIEHASPYGKDPGERVAGERKTIGRLAERAWRGRHAAPTPQPVFAAANCDIDRHLPTARPSTTPMRASDWLVSGLVAGEVAVLAYSRLRTLLKRRFDS